MSYAQKIKKGYEEKGEKIDFTDDIPECVGFTPTKDTTKGVILKPTIYFAHPWDKLGSKRETRIEEILTERGYIVVNPFKEENKLNKKYGVDNYYENPTYKFATDIVEKDWIMVFNCDEYFGWFPKNIAMIGTPIELKWAFILKKPITVLCYKPQPFLWKFCDVLYLNYKNFVGDEPFYVCTNREDKESFRQKVLKLSL